MKRFILWLFLPVLLAAAGGAVFYWLQSSYLPERLKGMAFFGQPARFEDTPKLSLWPPAIALGRVSWRGRAFGGEAAFSANSIQITPDLWSFLRGAPELREVIVDGPVLHIEKTGEQASPTAKTQAQALDFSIDRLVARNGSVSWVAKGMEGHLDDARLTAENLGPRQEMSLRGDFGLRLYAGGQELLDGNFAFQSNARFYPPNLTLRGGSATFTSAGSTDQALFSPLSSQFEVALNFASHKLRIGRATFSAPLGRLELSGENSAEAFSGKAQAVFEMAKLSPFGGKLELDSPFALTREKLSLSDAEIVWGNQRLHGNAEFLLAPGSDIFTFAGSLNDAGALRASLGTTAKHFELKLMGRNVSMAGILGHLGLGGLSGGETAFDFTASFAGDDVQAWKRSAKGDGQFQCGRLNVEPFGETALLLPLLGRRGALLPKAIDSASARLNIKDGLLAITTARATGPGFSANGGARINLLEDTLNAWLVLKAMGLELPLAFEGKLDAPGFRIDPDLLKRAD